MWFHAANLDRNFKSFEMNAFLKLLAVVSFLGLIPSVVGGLLGMNGCESPVGCENWAMGLDLGFYAARSYSLMRPPSTARRWIRCCERSAMG